MAPSGIAPMEYRSISSSSMWQLAYMTSTLIVNQFLSEIKVLRRRRNSQKYLEITSS